MIHHSGDKAAGVAILTPHDGREIQRDTLQCAHCGCHWIRQPGAGTKRGFCLKCDGVLCGKPNCMAHCYPMEQRQDDMAKYGRLRWPA